METIDDETAAAAKEFMRIDLTFKDFKSGTTEHRTLQAVEALINDGLGGQYYGPGLTWIEVSVWSHVKPERKLKRFRKYKGSFAEHVYCEIAFEFGLPEVLSRTDFCAALKLVEDAVNDCRDCWSGEFRREAFVCDLRELGGKIPANEAALEEFERSIPLLTQRIALKQLSSQERRRFEDPLPRARPLRGIRYYPSGRLENALEPYARNFCALFEGLLRAQQWLTPGYDEIYVNFAESDELARIHRTAVESWHENAYAVIPFDDYQAADPARRESLVFEAYCSALRELARIDHLDLAILDSAIAQTGKSGIAMDLEYLRQETATHRARILYRLRSDGGTPAFRLEVTDQRSGRIAERALEVRSDEEIWLAYRFGSLQLTKKQVRIHARKGERAQVFLHSARRPAVIAFDLDDLFPAERA